MTISTQLVIHSETFPELLEKIANIKSIRWQYPLEKQLQWMTDNLKSTDVHLLVHADDKLVAYTNFVDVKVLINEASERFMGIGNVCTSESGKGYGEMLMNAINDSILKNNWNGILLCKDNLVPYYEKYQWNLISPSVISSDIMKEINTMTFNFEKKIETLQYSDRNF